MDCQKRVRQVCVECAGGADTADESLLLSIAPVSKMSLGLQGHSQLLSPVPTHCAGVPAGEHCLKSPFCGLESSGGLGTAVGQLCPGAVPVLLTAHFSLWPFLSLCLKVLQLCSLGWPRGCMAGAAPAARSGSHAFPPGANPAAASCAWYFSLSCFLLSLLDLQDARRLWLGKLPRS